jgi:hypothetical protein
MIKINGTPLETKSKKVMPTFSVFKKQRKNQLISVLSVSLLQKDLMSLTFAHLWVPLGVFWSAGSQSTFLPL